jgi:hypothetical protein
LGVPSNYFLSRDELLSLSRKGALVEGGDCVAALGVWPGALKIFEFGAAGRLEFVIGGNEVFWLESAALRVSA